MYPVPSNNTIHPCFIQKKPTVKEVATAKLEEIAPLNGACQFKCVVYKAEVTVPNDEQLYYGISEGFIKPRISTTHPLIIASMSTSMSMRQPSLRTFSHLKISEHLTPSGGRLQQKLRNSNVVPPDVTYV